MNFSGNTVTSRWECLERFIALRPAIFAGIAMYPSNQESLADLYQRMFEAIPADTPELLEEAYKLRYQVYCIEHQFEDPARCKDGLERDAYDAQSLHAVLIHRRSRLTVGTIRLILHKPGARTGSLPFHRICSDTRRLDPSLLPLEHTAEFSRFAISKAFRRREGDGRYGRVEGLEDLIGDARRMLPSITLGLMTAAMQMGRPHGITHVCAVMDPALLRLLARLGIHFEELGPPVPYHGWRQPCFAAVRDLLHRVWLERPDIWDVITDRGRLWPKRAMISVPAPPSKAPLTV